MEALDGNVVHQQGAEQEKAQAKINPPGESTID